MTTAPNAFPDHDLAVVGGRIVTEREVMPGEVLIKGEKVVVVAPPGSARPGVEIIDARGGYVLPGLIDAHLHPVYADGMDTLSVAAAREGITTLIPYIGAVKAWGRSGGLVETLDEFITSAEAASVVDFNLHCTLMAADMEGVAETIPRLMERGITSFKGFMAYARRGMKLDDRQLLEVMSVIAAHGGLFAAHAENGDIIDHLEDASIAAGRQRPKDYPPTHPGICEAEAVFRLLSLGRVTGCKTYIPHISSARTLEVLELVDRWDGPGYFAETCPHYLCLTDELMSRFGSLAKMAPPLRKATDNEALWQAVAGGRIDVIASDHAAGDRAANEPVDERVFDAPNGIPGLETMVRSVWNGGVRNGRLDPPGLVRALSASPARIFGLYPQKGALEPGSDADVVIIDPEAEWRIPSQHPDLKVDYSIQEGRTGRGAPVLTMQRGRVLFSHGRLKAEAGRGRFLPARRITDISN